MQLRLSAERWAKYPKLKAKMDKSLSDSELAKKALKSSAQHFIDMNNNCPSPYDALREGRPLTPDRLLRYGLSGYNTQRKNGSYAFSGINQDGEGRAGSVQPCIYGIGECCRLFRNMIGRSRQVRRSVGVPRHSTTRLASTTGSRSLSSSSSER